MNEHYHLSIQESLSSLHSSKAGLNQQEANERTRQYGPNELAKEKKSPILTILMDQFKNFLILLLIAATLLAFLLGELLDGFAMLAIIALTIFLGFIQEYRAEKAIEALERISAPTARVLRDGQETKIPAAQLVPGDIIVLEEGDIVPADSRVIDSQELNIDEASLTGESVPSKKVTEAYPQGTQLADQENMAFMSTIVAYGKGLAVVVGTGMNTEMGKIAKSLQETKEVQTPLQRKFEQMSKFMGLSVIVLVAIVFVVGLLKAHVSMYEMFFFALSLAVAAVPSSLPAIVTISLALGARALATKNMIIKKLPAAESLGAVTIICSDKTGTLTKNQMTVTRMYFQSEIIDVSGAGYALNGLFTKKGRQLIENEMKQIELPLTIGSLCNNAKLHVSEKGLEVMGDPTEGSLLVLAKKGGIHEERLLQTHTFVHELPFDSDRKRMSVIFDERKTGKRFIYSKGAPESILERCNRILLPSGKARKLTAKDRKQILSANNQFARQALRVLAFAYSDIKKPASAKASRGKKAEGADQQFPIDKYEKDLIFVALAGMIDPPREEVVSAIAECRRAGIKVMMITGDQAITAEAVARKIGLYQDGDVILTGVQLSGMSDDDLFGTIDSLRIVARAMPVQKSRIVEMLQRKGHTVAMTGDGVNDAPALKKADIGVAMGITGTDVAKEVSKSILTDDNFASIVSAVAEGRNIYDKIVKSTRYLLSCNMGEITSVFVALILNFPLPMIPLQILMMNLVTDGLPAIGLGMESADEDVMSRPPRNPKEHPLSGQTLFNIVLFGIIMGAGAMWLFSSYYQNDIVHAQTIAFTSLVMFEMFAVLNNRSLLPFKANKLNIFTNKWLLLGVTTSIAFQLAVIYIPFLQPVFGTTALSWGDWGNILLTSAVGFIIMELSKYLFVHVKKGAGKVGKAMGMQFQQRQPWQPQQAR